MNTQERGRVTYDPEWGHVCTCCELDPATGDDGELYPRYLPSVHVDRSQEPTEGGSWYYRCSACGAGTWSGC